MSKDGHLFVNHNVSATVAIETVRMAIILKCSNPVWLGTDWSSKLDPPIGQHLGTLRMQRGGFNALDYVGVTMHTYCMYI